MTAPAFNTADYLAAGLSLVPITPGSKGPSGADALGWNTRERCVFVPEQITPTMGYGLAHAYSIAPTMALDLDDMNAASALLAEADIDLEALLLATDAVGVSSGSPNHGKLLFRLPFGTMPSKTVRNDGKMVLELRCSTAGGKTVQDCLPPTIHPGTLKPYKWVGHGDWRNIPMIPYELLAFWQGLIDQDGKRTIKVLGEIDASWSEIQAALFAIDPDCSREIWVSVLMALHYAGNVTEQLDEALHLANQWSMGGAKYIGPDDVLGRWKSFKLDHPNPVTLGSLFHHAKLAGWRRPMPDVSELFQDRNLQREEAKRIGEGETFSPLPEMMPVEYMEARHIFLSDGSRVFDRAHPSHVLAFPDFKNATSASFTLVPSGEYDRTGKEKMKRIPNAQLWLNSPSRLSAVSTTFKAGGDVFVTDPNGRHCVNLWNGFRRPAVIGIGSPDIFLEHVRWLFGDRADDFLDWLAHIEQQPGVLPHTAWLHISSHTGTGRNAMSAILARLFAGHAATSVDLVHILESGFNERLSRKVLAVVDEIREGGAGQWKHAENLKQMITAESRNINTKYGRQSLEHNACRFLMFSNHRAAIPLDDSDRRMEVVICDEAPKGGDYYSRLYGAVNDPEFIGAVAKWLGERDLSKFNPGKHAKKTAAKAQVVSTSTSSEVSALQDFNKHYPLELVTSKRLAQVAGMSVFSSGEAANFSRMANDAGWVKIGRKRFGTGLREILYATRVSASKWIAAGFGYESQLPMEDGGAAQCSWGLVT